MRILIKVITESIRQAFQQLAGNKLRTFLSLLGISIGIFCIIGVLSAVSSLESNLRGSMAKLGDNVVYIDKWPWKDLSDSWWDYLKRPYPDHDDYERLKEEMPSAALVNYIAGIGRTTLKYQSNSAEDVSIVMTTIEFDRMFNVDLAKGRFLSTSEYHYGSNKAVLGGETAEALFGIIDPVGKKIKMKGQNYEIIGVLATAGDDLINPLDFDDDIIIGYNNASRFVNLKQFGRYGGQVAVRAREGVSIQRLQDDIRGVMRSSRRLKPREEDDFAMNELSLISQAFDAFFGVLNLIGWLIGGLSILVGCVSVANIMFVSVKERTSLIGVKKALGAKEYIILLEFLLESIILCILGGLMGLLLVVGVTAIISSFLGFEIYLNATNAILGVSISVATGILAGAIPALLAARMDPVVAIRS